MNFIKFLILNIILRGKLNLEKIKMTKQYLLREIRTIAVFKNKKEAEENMDNHKLWYPNNCYEVVEQEVD